MILIKRIQRHLTLLSQLLNLVVESFNPVVDILNHPIFLNLNFDHLVLVFSASFLHQHSKLFPQVGNYLSIFLLFFVDLFNLTTIDENDIS